MTQTKLLRQLHLFVLSLGLTGECNALSIISPSQCAQPLMASTVQTTKENSSDSEHRLKRSLNLCLEASVRLLHVISQCDLATS